MKKSDPAPVVDLNQQRRLRRAATFIAKAMSTGAMEPPAGEIDRGTYTRYLPGVDLDLSVGRGAGPAVSKMLSWARRRAKNLLVLQLRDPSAAVVEARVHIVLVDGGVAFFPNYRLFSSEPCRGHPRWWLIDVVNPIVFHLGREGPVPTLSRPFSRAAERERGLAIAEQKLADFIVNAHPLAAAPA
jgi:hypothetical protein